MINTSARRQNVRLNVDQTSAAEVDDERVGRDLPQPDGARHLEQRQHVHQPDLRVRLHAGRDRSAARPAQADRQPC